MHFGSTQAAGTQALGQGGPRQQNMEALKGEDVGVEWKEELVGVRRPGGRGR